MNRVAFVFSSAPHGTASGREGLDALLATAILSKDVGVFFIGDGVFQILTKQNPKEVLARDYVSTFKLLPLYDVETFLVCSDSLRARGLSDSTPMVLNTLVVNQNALRKKLISYDAVLNF